MLLHYCNQRTLTLRGMITVRLVSSSTGLGSITLLHTNSNIIFLFGKIRTSKTGDHSYSDTSPYEEHSLHNVAITLRSNKGYASPYLKYIYLGNPGKTNWMCANELARTSLIIRYDGCPVMSHYY